MGKTIQVRVDESLMTVFGSIGKKFADKIKKEYNLTELFVPYSLSSQILAAKYKEQEFLEFKIKKTGPKSGILVIE